MALMKQILFQLKIYLKNSMALKLSKQKRWGEFWIAVEGFTSQVYFAYCIDQFNCLQSKYTSVNSLLE